jgi:hypothetical protein
MVLESTTTLPATHISSPWTQAKRPRETRNAASNSAYLVTQFAAAAPSHIWLDTA